MFICGTYFSVFLCMDFSKLKADIARRKKEAQERKAGVKRPAEEERGSAAVPEKVSKAGERDLLAEIEKTRGSVLEQAMQAGQTPAEEKLLERMAGLSEREVLERLRKMKEPIVLFGETESERRLRLARLEERVDATYEKNMLPVALEIMKHSEAVGVEKLKVSTEYLAELMEKETDTPKKQFLADSKDVLEYYLDLFLRWEATFDDEAVRERDRKMFINMRESREYVRPLFKDLSTGNGDPDVVEHLRLIKEKLEAREYMLAQEQYMALAIGNSPWPMGVTNVGIHERSARERIFSNQVAHIMNDEKTRKYLHAVKRLMTYCQQIHPTVPSKSVDYVPPRPQ